MKLLIADDDRVLTHLLSSRLRTKGWTVTVAADAMQTMMFAMRTQPDAILLDINMPGGTGIEALRKLKASVKTSPIPVVVLSGSIDPADEPMVRALGAEGFMQKPADIDALHALLAGLTGAPA
jgi:DNA-binding response OmpR family regulator